LQAGGEVGRFAECQLFLAGASAHFPHDDEPGVDPQTHGQLHTALLGQAGIQRLHGLHDAQPGPHGPLGIIFMRLRIAKVDQQAIAEILGDMALKAGNHLGTGVLIGPHDLAEVFGVELARQGSRVDEVTEEHGELAAFGLCGGGCSKGRCSLGEHPF
jgi:hypothetical protein